jgi:hypothetical protein
MLRVKIVVENGRRIHCRKRWKRSNGVMEEGLSSTRITQHGDAIRALMHAMHCFRSSVQINTGQEPFHANNIFEGSSIYSWESLLLQGQ